ncbi:MAG: MMPL family transporter [Deltaproteobacteria bacterium]|nr:MMPL family transporter [Deltaproteobacteria bacterium]
MPGTFLFTKPMNTVALIIYRLRYILVALSLIFTIIFGLSINMDLDNTISAWFAQDDPVSIDYHNYRDTFEGGRYMIVAVRSENLFSTPVLDYIRNITEDLKNIDLAKRVHSLANSNRVTGTEEGIVITPLLNDLEKADPYDIRDYALNDEIFKDYLVSADGTLSAVVIVFDDLKPKQIVDVIQEIETILGKDRPQGVETFLAGGIMINHEFNEVTEQNETILPLFGVILVLTMTYILFRSIPKNIIVISVIAMSLCWTLGFYSMLGYTYNAVSGLIIPLIVILSIANTVHIIEYFDEVSKENDARSSYIATIQYITIPCFITSVTTSFGLFSLVASPITAVQHFGITSAAGIMFAFFISIALVPFLLTLLPSQKRVHHRYWGHALAGIFHINEKRYRLILFITAACIIFFGFGVKRVVIETNELEWFPKDSDMYINSMTLDRELAGVGALELIIEGEEEVLKDPVILNKIDNLSKEIRQITGVKKIISLADYVKSVNRALNANEQEAYMVPGSQELIAQEILLFSFSVSGTEELERVVNMDYSKGRIAIKIKYASSHETRALISQIEEKARQAFSGTDVKISLTGSSYLFSMLDKYIVESQIKTFSLAFILVIGILFVVFRSLKYGLLCILPNLLPITMIIGIMGWVGINLNVGTVMIASVALGICVDDTIHFLSRFRKEFADKGHTIHSAIRKTTIFVGRAIIFTSLISIGGFSIVWISDFQPSKDFGLLLSITLLLALVCDLFLLPACMIAIKRFFTKPVGHDDSI